MLREISSCFFSVYLFVCYFIHNDGGQMDTFYIWLYNVIKSNESLQTFIYCKDFVIYLCHLCVCVYKRVHKILYYKIWNFISLTQIRGGKGIRYYNIVEKLGPKKVVKKKLPCCQKKEKTNDIAFAAVQLICLFTFYSSSVLKIYRM